VQRFTEAAYAAVANGRKLVDDLRALRADWDVRVRARRDAAAWRVADLLLQHPVVNVALLSGELGIAPQNVYRSIAPLVEAKVLMSSGRQRDRVWKSLEVLAALDAFAQRASRRVRADTALGARP
jgi:hypothetical protein